MKTTSRSTHALLVLTLAMCFCAQGPRLSARECPDLMATMLGGMYHPTMVVSGDIAYVIDGGGFLTVFDMTRPAEPVVTWSGVVCNPYYDEPVYDVEISQGIIFALYGQYGPSSWQKLCVVDVSSPATPIPLGSDGFDLQGTNTQSLSVAGGYAYLAGYPSTNNMYVELGVYDVMVPSAPALVGSYHFHPGPEIPDDLTVDVSVSGGHAYVLAGFRLKVFDVMVPSSPVEVGSLDLTEAGERMVLSGDHAYVAGPTGLRVVDVSTASAPIEEGFVATAGYVTGIAVAGGLVYLTNPIGLQVLEVRTSSSPAEVGSAELPPLVEDVATSGRYAYVVVGTAGGEEDGLYVFDGGGCRRPWQQPAPPALE